MSHQAWTRSRKERAAIVAAFLLLLTVGAGCLAHGHQAGPGHHGWAPEPCAAAAVFSLVVVLLAGPLPSGWLRPDSARSTYAVSLALLDPPPRLLPA